ncbi:unnamed protein product, partial [Protopolystoma xenopodis]
DELLGSRSSQHCWRPHCLTYRGWELRQPVHLEVPSDVGPVNSVPISTGTVSNSVFNRLHSTDLPDELSAGLRDPEAFNEADEPTDGAYDAKGAFSLIIHSNEQLSAVLDRSSFLALASLQVYNQSDKPKVSGISSTSSSRLMPFAFMLGPSPVISIGQVQSCSKSSVKSGLRSLSGSVSGICTGTTRTAELAASRRPSASKRAELEYKLLEPVYNRKPVGELGIPQSV